MRKILIALLLAIIAIALSIFADWYWNMVLENHDLTTIVTVTTQCIIGWRAGAMVYFLWTD